MKGEKMEARLQKWGNSNGIRIPQSILKALNLKTNDKVEIEKVEDKIIITVPKEKKESLKELFDEYKGENFINDDCLPKPNTPSAPGTLNFVKFATPNFI